MASTKRTRQVASRRFDTILLKDLQSLGQWSHYVANPSQGRVQNFSSLLDDHCLRCEETLEDLEDVWARPQRPNQAHKAQSKRAISQTTSSQDADDVWAIPFQGKRPRKAKPKRRQTPLNKELHPASPVAPSVVPPNSPADMSPAGQSSNPSTNPYITYLIQTWEASGSPVLVSRSNQHGFSANKGHRPVVQSLQEEDMDMDMMLVRPDDVLVIPDSSREEFVSQSCVALDNKAREELAQCVPEESQDLQLSQSGSSEMESLFAEEDGEDTIALDLSQDNSHQQDHIVPPF